MITVRTKLILWAIPFTLTALFTLICAVIFMANAGSDDLTTRNYASHAGITFFFSFLATVILIIPIELLKFNRRNFLKLYEIPELWSNKNSYLEWRDKYQDHVAQKTETLYHRRKQASRRMHPDVTNYHNAIDAAQAYGFAVEYQYI